MDAILVATDGSESARDAVRFAIDRAHETGAELHVLSVRAPTFHGRGGPAPLVRPLTEMRGAAVIADAAADEARAAGVRAQSHQVGGDVVRAICAMADRLGVDLVVVGSHGRGTTGVAVFGSVSRTLVTHCKRPVTVVRSKHVHAATDAGGRA
jgi:nucleotide-binding universal stress UspA family protein